MTEAKTTILLRGGTVAASGPALFRRVFWKSAFLAEQAFSFWREVRRLEPEGLQVQAWKDWTLKRHMSVGQFYNMVHGLLGAGLVERKDARWHVSKSFLQEVEAMLQIHSKDQTETSTPRP